MGVYGQRGHWPSVRPPGDGEMTFGASGQVLSSVACRQYSCGGVSMVRDLKDRERLAGPIVPHAPVSGFEIPLATPYTSA